MWYVPGTLRTSGDDAEDSQDQDLHHRQEGNQEVSQQDLQRKLNNCDDYLRCKGEKGEMLSNEEQFAELECPPCTDDTGIMYNDSGKPMGQSHGLESARPDNEGQEIEKQDSSGSESEKQKDSGSKEISGHANAKQESSGSENEKQKGSGSESEKQENSGSESEKQESSGSESEKQVSAGSESEKHDSFEAIVQERDQKQQHEQKQEQGQKQEQEQEQKQEPSEWVSLDTDVGGADEKEDEMLDSNGSQEPGGKDDVDGSREDGGYSEAQSSGPED